MPYTISFSGQEVPGANYAITGWTIQWGDGTTSTLPSDATSATHVYTTDGNDTITATAADPYFLATTITQPVAVSFGTQSVSAGGPYTISTGASLVLTGTAAGTPSGFCWFANGQLLTVTGQTTSSGNGSTTDQATVSWAVLQALGVDEGTTGAITVAATYADGSSATSAPATLTVNPTPPTATFTGTNALLGGTSTVSFTNPFDPSAKETAAGFTYSYDFSNNGTFAIAGSTSPTATVPANLLAQPGSFVVHGRITAQDGQFTDYYTTIHVAEVAPTVSVGPGQTISPGSPFALNGVTFSDPGYATSSSSGNFTATINWGDGTTTPGALTVTQGSAGVPTTGVVSGSHVYQPDRTYTVTVTVFDSDGEQGSGSFQVTVGAPTVTVTAGPNQTVGAGAVFIPSQTVFTDNAAPDTDTATINWGDGSPLETVPASELHQPAAPGSLGTIAAGHIYGYPGSYTMTVAVADSFGASNSGSFQVNVLDVVPTVTAGPNLNQSPGVPVSLSSTFTDPGFPVGSSAETYSATINWGDGTTSPGTVTTTPGGPGVPTSGTVSGTHTYKTHGDFGVTVTVLDSLGQQGSGTLTALDVSPTVAAGPNPTVNQGSPAAVAATFTDPGYEAGATAASYTATINWGDGTTSPGTVTMTPGGPGVPTTGTIAGSHIYADQGTYPVTVSLVDDGGGVGQASLTATVQDVGPTLAPLLNGGYVQGQPLIIQDTFTEPGIADRDTVTVNWGDGITSTIDSSSMYQNANGVLVPFLVEPTATSPGSITLGHVYNDRNPHTVTITVTDKDGLSSTISVLYEAVIPTTTTVTSSTGGSSVYGQPVTFTATVAAPPGFVTPTGTVTFDVNGVAVAHEALSGGTAQFTPASPLPVGPDTITAFYGGAGAYTPSDNTAAPPIQTVNKDSTTTTVASSTPSNVSVYGQSVTFTATVSVNSPGAGTPTGSVTFYDNGVAIGTGTLNGVSGKDQATFTTSALSVAKHPITAKYGGDTDDLTSSSSVLTQTVNQDATTTTISASTTSPSFGQAVTLTARTTANAPGSVSFLDVTTGITLGTGVLSGGVASLTISTLEPGAHSVEAIYGGDVDFLGSTSNPNVTVTVGNALFVLSPSASGALEVAGGTSVNEAGPVYVDSSSASAIVASGSASVTATSIQVVGGVSVSGTAKLSPKPVTGAKSVPDPLADLAVPPVGPVQKAVSLSGSSTLTINPGVYSQISVAGNAQLTMNPGIYEIAGGGFSVSYGGKVTGSGVLIYNAGSKYPSAGGTFGAVSISGNASVQLSAPTTGPYAGIVLFQSRDNTQAIAIGGSAVAKLTGTVYAPAAMVSVTGLAQFVPEALVVNEIQLQGSGTASADAIAGSPSAPQGPLAMAGTGPASTSSGLEGTSRLGAGTSPSPTRWRRGATARPSPLQPPPSRPRTPPRPGRCRWSRPAAARMRRHRPASATTSS